MVNSEEVLEAHRKGKGKIEIFGKVAVDTKEELSTFYTPGVAFACLEITKRKESVYDYTLKGRTVAIITDGTRILGLGKIGAEAGLPVMEGKALLFKRFGGVDAFPIGIDTTDEEKLVEIIKSLQPSFGAINIEDMETPKVFRIVERLKKELDIPVFHDDRSGIAVVALAALFNALKLARKKLGNAKIVVYGAGAAGAGIAELLDYAGAKNICIVDTSGTIYKGRKENMNPVKEMLAGITNRNMIKGDLSGAVKGADVLIGVSTKGTFDKELVSAMSDKPIVFALSNPDPEISYKDARAAGAFVVATGRSDTPNQVNNLLVFPGLLRGLLEVRARAVDEFMLLSVAKVIAKSVGKKLSAEYIVPDLSDRKMAEKLVAEIAAETAEAAMKQGLGRLQVSKGDVRKSVKESLKRYRRIERFVSKV